MMISAVVPAYNEEESIEAFFKVLVPNLEKADKNYEIVFVDDGSTDTTLSKLKEFEAKNKSVRVLSFRKNKGKAEALTAGFQKAKGDLIVTLDADLQDRPEEIENLIKKQKEGFDLVAGWRKNRKDALKTKVSSKLFNFLMGAFWGVKLHDYNCGLKLYTKDAAQSLNLYGGMHRFIPLLVTEKGFTVTELAVVHEKRKFGKSKYGISKIFKDIPDMFTILFLTSYSERPSHFFSLVGGIFSLSGVVFLIYLSVLHFLFHQRVGTRPLWSVGVVFLLIGFQTIFTGFLADLMINIHHSRLDENDFERKIKFKNE